MEKAMGKVVGEREGEGYHGEGEGEHKDMKGRIKQVSSETITRILELAAEKGASTLHSLHRYL